MKIVVDTNIAFSAILNRETKIGDLLMNSEGLLEFHACQYLRQAPGTADGHLRPDRR